MLITALFCATTSVSGIVVALLPYLLIWRF
jgi:hypothetical protein